MLTKIIETRVPRTLPRTAEKEKLMFSRSLWLVFLYLLFITIVAQGFPIVLLMAAHLDIDDKNYKIIINNNYMEAHSDCGYIATRFRRGAPSSRNYILLYYG